MMREISLDKTSANPKDSASPDVEIRGVLLPLQATYLLLPNVTVVEVIGFREEEQIENAPGWLRGLVTWSQRRIPVVSFEYFVHQEVADAGYRARIALCKNLNGDPRLPFIGILCRSIPRLARVNNQTVAEVQLQEMMPEMTLKHITYNGEDAWIPDLEKLANSCVKILLPGV
jgi:chemosensory pili system protein ChpC